MPHRLGEEKVSALQIKSRRRSGQVLVLACVAFLLTALMLMASFSVANAVHERIRIQAAADARAFSIATMEARGFNTVAFMNRAIAGAIVGNMAIHAWKALAQHNVNMLRAGQQVFILVAVTELAQCPKFKIQHCIHAFQAFRISSRYGREARSQQSKLDGADSKLRDASEAYSKLIEDIHKAQQGLLDQVKNEVQSGPTLMGMLSKTAPLATGKDIDLNKDNLACALEGSKFDDDCKAPGWKGVGTVSDKDKRRQVMESAAMATRTKWEAGTPFERASSHDEYRGDVPIGIPVYDPDKAMNIQGEGHYIEFGLPNKAEVGNNKVNARSGGGALLVNWKHGCFSGWCPWFVQQGTAQSGGEYKGIVCDGSGGCFINFRLAEKGEEDDWGQPATYGAITQETRKNTDQVNRREKDTLGKKRPWELEDGKGEVQFLNGQGKFKYVSSDQAYAVAKGKAYFHQLGAWSAPPNVFDPFWRAKLHPFVRDELADVLRKAGDSNGQQIISGGQTSVEGVIK